MQNNRNGNTIKSKKTFEPRSESRSLPLTCVSMFIALLLILSSCGGQDLGTGKATATLDPIKIGASLPLTGEAATFGAAVKGGIEIAASEINAAGGIDGRKIQVIYEDDKCAKDGVTTITKLTTSDNVDAIVGPFCSAAAGPGLPIAQAAGVPSVIWASAPHLTAIGDYIFRVYPSDSFAGKFLADYIYNTLGKRKAALVYVKNDWGQGVRGTFSARFQELGGQIVFEDSLNQDEQDARTLIQKISRTDADVIAAPLYPANGLAFVKQSHELGLDLSIMGGEAYDAQEFFGSKDAQGTYLYSPHLINPEDFQAKMKALGLEPSAYAPLGYDAVKVLESVWKKVGTDKPKVMEALKSTDMPGLSTPRIAFDEVGDLKYALYDVKVVKDQKAVMIYDGATGKNLAEAGTDTKLEGNLDGNAKDSQESDLKKNFDGAITIGFSGALTGEAANIGTYDKNGVILGVDDINAAGGINGKELKVIYEDAKCSPKDAISTTTKLIATDKVPIILGGTCSGETLAMAPMAQEAGVLLFTTFSSNPKIKDAGDFVFRNTPSDLGAGKQLAEEMLKRHKTVAIISENTDFAQGLRQVFLSRAKEIGLNVVADEAWETTNEDVRTQLTKIKQANPEALFINPQGDPTGGRVLKQAREIGVEAKAYFAYYGSSKDLQENAGKDNIEGMAWLDIQNIDETNPVYKVLESKHVKKFGEKPMFSNFMAASYDRTMILGDAMKTCTAGGKALESSCVRDYLYAMPPYKGVLGTFHFDKDGEVVGIGYEMYEIRNGTKTRWG